MARLVTFIAILAALGLPGSAAASGSDSFSLDVSADVLATCTITSSGPYTLEFTLDPSVETDAVAATSALSFWCTDGLDITVSDDGNGVHSLSGPDQDPIPYTLTYTPSQPSGSGPSNQITLTITGAIAHADYSTKKAGRYTDRVTVTINP